MMTSIEPQVSENGRYGVMETSRILGIAKGTLRAHTLSGHIRCGYRAANGRKFYRGGEILRFWRAQM